jgi:N-acylneuraminate cytidylyltransferase
MKKVNALIPLRKGSKSIPGKNIKTIAGKPLCQWVLESAINCEVIDNVYVSTDGEEIKAVVESLRLGVKIISRSPECATDEATTESVIFDFISQVDSDIIITIQATSPQLTTQDLNLALQQFKSENLDSMLTAVRSKRFYWSDDHKPINYNPMQRPRRQDFNGTLMENGAFYITKREILEQYKCRLGGKIGIYVMNESTATEIDEPDDWLRVERDLLRK